MQFFEFLAKAIIFRQFKEDLVFAFVFNQIENQELQKTVKIA